MFSELKNMRGDADQVADVRNRWTSITGTVVNSNIFFYVTKTVMID